MKKLIVALCAVICVACSQTEPVFVASIPLDGAQVERGRVLVKGLAACGFCHGEQASPNSLLLGGRALHDRYGDVNAPNLTSAKSGLGAWRDVDVMRAIRASMDRDGNWLSSEVHQGYDWMSDADTFAIVTYLRSLPAVEKDVARRTLSFMDRNTTGFFDSRAEVRGYVPEVRRSDELAYGEYLVDHVARCSSCHNSPGSLIDSEGYLLGGKTITNNYGSKVAPGITSSRVYGIGEWDEAAIVQYLQTGSGPDGRVSDSHFCPWEFYALADKEDLRLIARYLRAVPG
ncbi:MAG: cytochrome c [Oligoflexia bacterium]|nr:cytochrome c [Oligoflexia bacterium]